MSPRQNLEEQGALKHYNELKKLLDFTATEVTNLRDEMHRALHGAHEEPTWERRATCWMLVLESLRSEIDWYLLPKDKP